MPTALLHCSRVVLQGLPIWRNCLAIFPFLFSKQAIIFHKRSLTFNQINGIFSGVFDELYGLQSLWAKLTILVTWYQNTGAGIFRLIRSHGLILMTSAIFWTWSTCMRNEILPKDFTNITQNFRLQPFNWITDPNYASHTLQPTLSVRGFQSDCRINTVIFQVVFILQTKTNPVWFPSQF